MFENGKILYFAGKSFIMKKIASILLFCLLLWGCKKPVAFEYRGLKNFQLVNFNGDTATLSATISFYNPNNFGVNLKKINADISANGSLLTHYVLDTSISIPAESLFDFPASIKFDRRAIFNNIADAFFKREILLHIKGNSRVGRAGIFVNVPFDVSSKQAIKF